jgi:integrase
MTFITCNNCLRKWPADRTATHRLCSSCGAPWELIGKPGTYLHIEVPPPPPPKPEKEFKRLTYEEKEALMEAKEKAQDEAIIQYIALHQAGKTEAASDKFFDGMRAAGEQFLESKNKILNESN